VEESCTGNNAKTAVGHVTSRKICIVGRMRDLWEARMELEGDAGEAHGGGKMGRQGWGRGKRGC